MKSRGIQINFENNQCKIFKCPVIYSTILYHWLAISYISHGYHLESDMWHHFRCECRTNSNLLLIFIVSWEFMLMVKHRPILQRLPTGHTPVLHYRHWSLNTITAILEAIFSIKLVCFDSTEYSFRWCSRSTLVQLMAWHQRVAIHYLDLGLWPRPKTHGSSNPNSWTKFFGQKILSFIKKQRMYICAHISGK